MNKDLIKFYINFETYRLKVKLNRFKSGKLRCDEFVMMVLKKFKAFNQSGMFLSADKYGLFECSDGIEMMIPDSKLVLQMDKMLTNKTEFIIRKKNFFELNQNNELTNSQRSKILSFFKNSRQNCERHCAKIKKYKFVSLKTTLKNEIISNDCIKQTKVLKLQLVQKVQKNENCFIEEKTRKMFLIKKIIKIKKVSSRD